MDELYEKLGILNLWGDSVSSDQTSFEVTEGWLNHKSGKVKHKNRPVHSDNLTSWLAEESKVVGDETQSLVMRLVWVGVDVKGKKVLLSESVKQVLLQTFGLEKAFSYAQSCITNVSAFSPSQEQPGQRAYSFCYVPKVASVWSHSRFETQAPTDRPFLTQGLVFLQGQERETLSVFMNRPWNASLYGNAMFPAFLFSLLLSAQIHQTEATIKTDVRAIESRTGHHMFASRDVGEAATEEIGQLSAQTNGHATKLASVVRKSKMIENLLDFVTRNLQEEDVAQAAARVPQTDGCRFLKNHVDILRDRLAMQTVDTDFTLKRVQIQINALAAIISRNDSLSNISLSKSQREIALHSYRDSSSMKTLAIVTMFFLPGSFISALFSTQLFDWESVDASSNSMGVKANPQFKLYWVITISLTVVTFLLYFLWLWFLKRQRDQIHQDTSLDGFDKLSLSEKGETEEIRLSRNRKETMLSKKSTSLSGSW
ncbi:hypothetical protein PT974_05752 [Cladobotryum mycophilum]|uniref:Uncharacterized protein n=1 Tax=Cladobotryum mycophilum TaxID=491253 RepID=A0ABR0SJM8_9HYPO